MKNKIKRFGLFIFLQFAVMIYSVNTVVAKFVARESWFSLRFISLYLLEFVVLGIYAILWQQIIKRVELSVAYANKAMTLMWSLVWGVVLFREGVTFLKVAGVLLVIAGTVLLNLSPPADTSSGQLTEESQPQESQLQKTQPQESQLQETPGEPDREDTV